MPWVIQHHHGQNFCKVMALRCILFSNLPCPVYSIFIACVTNLFCRWHIAQSVCITRNSADGVAHRISTKNALKRKRLLDPKRLNRITNGYAWMDSGLLVPQKQLRSSAWCEIKYFTEEMTVRLIAHATGVILSITISGKKIHRNNWNNVSL